MLCNQQKCENGSRVDAAYGPVLPADTITADVGVQSEKQKLMRVSAENCVYESGVRLVSRRSYDSRHQYRMIRTLSLWTYVDLQLCIPTTYGNPTCRSLVVSYSVRTLFP